MPVNFFHLTSAATDAAEAALNEAPSPVSDQRPSNGAIQDPGPGPGRAAVHSSGIDGTTEDRRPTADGA